MAAVAWIALDRRHCRADPWPQIAATIAEAAGQRRLELRDCIVLVPFAQLLPLANQAFAERGGWMPRIETTGSLAQAFSAQASTEAEGLTFDSAIDALNAQAILSRQVWARSWQERDPRGFAIAAVHLAQTSHTFARCAQAMRPAARGGYWTRAREGLTLVDGSGARERVIARIALEWAALSAAPATDHLFSIGPAAWFAVNAGGRDALTLNLLDASPAQTPCIVVDLDAGNLESVDASNLASSPALALCEDFEDEAQCAAAQVLRHLQLGQRPVALVAQDRILVRRVRALLERESVSIRDETGWNLATTRAAARVMALLHAARPDASTDNLLDWLKTGVSWPEVPDAEVATASLEAHCRKLRLPQVKSLHDAALDLSSRRLLRRALASLKRMPTNGSGSLDSWLGALSAALDDCGAMTELREDGAGRQLISTLGLVGTESARLRELRSWAAAGHVMLTLTQFTNWVDAALERGRFLPESVRMELADVIIAPLAQTILRPFAAIVFPGTDHTRLGAASQLHPLLSDAQAVALGLEGAQQRREIERLGFAQLGGSERLTLLRRRQDGDQLTTNSPLVETSPSGSTRESKRFSSVCASSDAVRVWPTCCRSACRQAHTRPCVNARIAFSPRWCCACACVTSLSETSKSATTETGCTPCCCAFTSAVTRQRRLTWRWSASWQRQMHAKPKAVLTMPSSCPTQQRSRRWHRATWSGCTHVMRKASVGCTASTR
jgi:ATP-dependent helicase/nuclease subunit B